MLGFSSNEPTISQAFIIDTRDFLLGIASGATAAGNTEIGNDILNELWYLGMLNPFVGMTFNEAWQYSCPPWVCLPPSPMTRAAVISGLFALVLTLGSCGAFAPQANEEFPEIPIQEVSQYKGSSFNVRGHVIAVICPRFEQCIRGDGLRVSIKPAELQNVDPESVKEQRQRNEIVFLGSYRLGRFNITNNRRYLVSYTKGEGVVGVSLLDE